MTEPKGILAGTGQLVDNWLRVPDIGTAPHYRHKTAAQRLSGKAVSVADTTEFLERAYMLIDNNWQAAQAINPRKPSKQNWRFTARPDIAPQNSSPEVVLERAIVRHAPGEWANQIPTSSGMVGSSADKIRNIDLALRHGPTEYTFFELKVASNTPVFAAVEILLYWLLYLWSRAEAKRIGYGEKRIELFAATRIDLRTLAPMEYYDGIDLRLLELSIDEGIRKFVGTKIGRSLKISFMFEALGQYAAATDVETVRRMVENRSRVNAV